MLRLFLSFLLAGLIILPGPVSATELNSSEDGGNYVVGQLALLSFSDAVSLENPANITWDESQNPVSLNQTRRGGEMTARKLFEMREAARADIRAMVNNESLELSTGLSPTKAQSFAIVCKQCVPEKKAI